VDGVVQERQLRLGLRTLAAAVVLEGLRLGDAVLTGSEFKVGQRVTVLVVPWQTSVRPAGGRDDAAGGAGSALTNAMGR
jgi:HlyD family secretion protein